MHGLTKKFYENFKTPEGGRIPMEDVYERYGHELALTLACNAGNEQCLAETFSQVHQYVDHDYLLPPGLEVSLLCSGLRGSDKQEEWVGIWTKMASNFDATFKARAINALGCSDDPQILKDYLESTLGSGNSVNYTQAERRNVLASVLNSYSGLDAVISFIKEFELDIMSFYSYSLETLLTVPARTIKSREQEKVYKDFLATLTHLDAAVLVNVIAVIDANFATQQTTQNAKFLNTIRKILGRPVDDTTTTERITPPTPSTTTTLSPTTSTTPRQNEETTSTTTLGASSVGIKLFTIISTLFLVFTLRLKA
jgi:ERAP1-like C-terminal domain